MIKDRKNGPLVSVVISVYNENPLYLKEAIRSVLEQTYRNLEIIIIDDGSNDRACLEVLDKAQRMDARVTVVHNQENAGLTKSLNAGLEMAKGKYLARMDSDDISEKNRIEEGVNYLEKYTSVTVAVTRICEAVSGKQLRIMGEQHFSQVTAVRFLFRNAGVVHPTAMIRMDFLKKHNIRYNEKYRYAQDYALWTDIVFKGGIIRTMPKVLVRYRIHNNQITNKTRDRQLLCSRKIQREYVDQVCGSCLDKKEWEIFYSLTAFRMTGSLSENINAIKKIEKNNRYLNRTVLQKELLMLWWQRGWKLWRRKNGSITWMYFVNTYALSLFRPDNMVYALFYFIFKG